jgi:hypothetical protein
MQRLLFLLSIILFLTACNTGQEQVATPAAAKAAPAPGHFTGGLYEYWYEGLAEINTYELQQARYGEMRAGTVTAIFVSEDFLTDKQVKNDNYSNPTSTPIIKTNMIRRFVTGVYDYSLMTSVFTPTKTDEHAHTLKVTTSMQDWCGQTFTQLNYAGGDRWDVQLRSYFEKEGDVDESIPADFLEDEVFNRIRSGWEELPTGTFRVLPGTAYLLMTHQPYRATKATVSLSDYTGEDFTEAGLKSYVVDYGEAVRKLEVIFDAAAPYVIRGWKESYPSRGKNLTTVAKLSHQVLAPYWSQNGVKDEPLRAALGL